MSQWLKVGLEISAQHLDVFAQACTEMGLEFNAQTLSIRDCLGSSRANLVEENDNYRFRVDTDGHYSSISRRLGKDCAPLMQKYAELLCEQALVNQGGYVTERETNSDGSLVLTVAIGY